MGADVLAGLGSVAVTVWEWLAATFAWSDALVLVVGVASVVVGSIAICQSRKSRSVARGANTLSGKSNEIAESAKSTAERANEIAQGANRLSENANEIAEAANTLAERAITMGEGANEIAEEANRIARRANDLAREANDLSKQRDKRETERHDVRWEGEFVEPGVYRLTNKGEHTAYKVAATVEFEGEEARGRSDRVGHGEFLDLELSSASAIYEQARQQIRQLEAQRKEMEERFEHRGGPTGVGPATSDKYRSFQRQIEQIRLSAAATYVVDQYVHWETEQGSPRTHRDSGDVGSLGAEL
ncbi:hypothetical protein ACFVWN_01205 [Nocardiopsis flavescens]|uniref:hypothetical protein n=1 Tax=Nocardiopsis flavescens TaxID=758803 RepID=UPI00365CAF28